MRKELKTIPNQDFKEPMQADVFRCYFNDKDNIIIEFGKMNDDENVRVISSVSVPPKFLVNIAEFIINTGCAYQKAYDIDIHFPQYEHREDGENE